MPELPEVETVRRGLAPAMEGGRLNGLMLNRPNLRFPFPANLARRLQGRKIIALSRRAKYLLMEFDGDQVLVCHLGMSGSFRVECDASAVRPGVFYHARSERNAHDHVIFDIVHDDGRQYSVIYNDPRRFGFMFDAARADIAQNKHMRMLGIEPMGNALSPDYLAGKIKHKAAPLKSVLLDQSIVAGLGNIYVCEALWRSKLSPLRAANTLVGKNGKPLKTVAPLIEAIKSVLNEAIEAGGSSLRDHRQADGTLGYFQHRFNVYDRENSPCARPGCNGNVNRIVQSGRSTFFCPVCQK